MRLLLCVHCVAVSILTAAACGRPIQVGHMDGPFGPADAGDAEPNGDAEPDAEVDTGVDAALDTIDDAEEPTDAADAVGTAEVGEACVSAADCAPLGGTMECMTSRILPPATPVDFPGGYCTVPCSVLLPDCGAHALCLPLLGDTGLCVRDCISCTRIGYLCSAPTGTLACFPAP